MSRARTQYKLVGRYLNGNDTKYYGLVSEDNKQVKYTSEQMAFMVGRGQVVNVGAQIYQGKLLFRGQNCDIKSLPTIQLRKDKDTGKIITTPVAKKPVAEPIRKPTPVVKKPAPVVKKPAPVAKKPVAELVRKPAPVAKPVQDEEEYLDPSIVASVAEYLGITINGRFKYSVLINKLLGLFNKTAYNATKTLYYMDMAMLELPVTVDAVDDTNKMYYIHFNKWGSKSVVYAVISESTFKLFNFEYASLVLDIYDGKVNGVEYKPMHYHELIIRLGLFSKIPEFKRLKLWYMRYNEEVFMSKLNPNLVVMLGNYAEASDFVDLRKRSGYSSHTANGAYPVIMLNYRFLKSFNNVSAISRTDACVLLHEMAHAYVDIIYGSNQETDPEKMGDVLYGMPRDPGMQYTMHGEKFGKTVKMISDKTGLSFDEVFQYNIHVNNVRKHTEFADRLSPDNYSNVVYSKYGSQNKPDSVVTAQHKGLAKVKEVLVSKQDYLKQFFRNNFNMTLDFNITADDSKLSITDSAGVLKNYDINFSDSNGQALTIYRQMDDRWINIGAVPIKSTPQAVVKNALGFVYKDSLLD